LHGNIPVAKICLHNVDWRQEMPSNLTAGGVEMTTANKVTIFRILVVPCFVVLLLYYFESGNERYWTLALLAYLVTAVLDGVDGYIARRYHQKSELGSIIDPLADKLLLTSGLVLLSIYKQDYLHRIPTWLTAVVLSRDVILLIGLVVIYYLFGKVKLDPCRTGKIATVLQMITVGAALFNGSPSLLYYLALAAAVLTASSGLYYIYEGVKQIGRSPSSSPNHSA